MHIQYRKQVWCILMTEGICQAMLLQSYCFLGIVTLMSNICVSHEKALSPTTGNQQPSLNALSKAEIYSGTETPNRLFVVKLKDMLIVINSNGDMVYKFTSSTARHTQGNANITKSEDPGQNDFYLVTVENKFIVFNNNGEIVDKFAANIPKSENKTSEGNVPVIVKAETLEALKNSLAKDRGSKIFSTGDIIKVKETYDANINGKARPKSTEALNSLLNIKNGTHIDTSGTGQVQTTTPISVRPSSVNSGSNAAANNVETTIKKGMTGVTKPAADSDSAMAMRNAIDKMDPKKAATIMFAAALNHIENTFGISALKTLLSANNTTLETTKNRSNISGKYKMATKEGKVSGTGVPENKITAKPAMTVDTSHLEPTSLSLNSKSAKATGSDKTLVTQREATEKRLWKKQSIVSSNPNLRTSENVPHASEKGAVTFSEVTAVNDISETKLPNSGENAQIPVNADIDTEFINSIVESVENFETALLLYAFAHPAGASVPQKRIAANRNPHATSLESKLERDVKIPAGVADSLNKTGSYGAISVFNGQMAAERTEKSRAASIFAAALGETMQKTATASKLNAKSAMKVQPEGRANELPNKILDRLIDMFLFESYL